MNAYCYWYRQLASQFYRKYCDTERKQRDVSLVCGAHKRPHLHIYACVRVRAFCCTRCVCTCDFRNVNFHTRVTHCSRGHFHGLRVRFVYSLTRTNQRKTRKMKLYYSSLMKKKKNYCPANLSGRSYFDWKRENERLVMWAVAVFCRRWWISIYAFRFDSSRKKCVSARSGFFISYNRLINDVSAHNYYYSFLFISAVFRLVSEFHRCTFHLQEKLKQTQLRKYIQQQPSFRYSGIKLCDDHVNSYRFECGARARTHYSGTATATRNAWNRKCIAE